MTPIFLTENLTDTGFAKAVGQENKHLKCSVQQLPNKNFIGAIGFNLGEKINLVTQKKTFSTVYSIDENEWNGNVSLQLKLRDIG